MFHSQLMKTLTIFAFYYSFTVVPWGNPPILSSVDLYNNIFHWLGNRHKRGKLFCYPWRIGVKLQVVQQWTDFPASVPTAVLQTFVANFVIIFWSHSCWFMNNVVAVFTQVLKDKGLWPATIFGFSHIRFKLFSWQFETLANLSLCISTVCFRNITWVEHVLFRPFVRIKLTLLAFSITSHFRLLPMILHSVSAASDPWYFLMFSCFSAIIVNCIETWALLSALRFARRGCCVPLLDDVCTTVCIAGVLSDTAWYITSWTVDALIFVCNWVVAMVNVCSTMAPVSNI